MRYKYLKTAVIIIVTLLFLFSIAQVYARSLGIDLLSLAREKVASILNVDITRASTELEGDRQQVEDDILAYVDSYIKGIEDELKIYSKEQEEESKNKLGTSYNDIKNDLDSIRQGIIDDAKQQIKQAIDQKCQEEQDKLYEDLEEKVSDKFKE